MLRYYKDSLIGFKPCLDRSVDLEMRKIDWSVPVILTWTASGPEKITEYRLKAPKQNSENKQFGHTLP